jgi:uncharacterized protein (DUF2062 family)
MAGVMTHAGEGSLARERRAGFWQRRVVAPLLAWLAQGATPAMLSRTIAAGVVCGIFPFLGTTTSLTFLAGIVLRMNQPILHTLNQLLGPVQLVLIPVFVRAGEGLWRAEAGAFSVTGMVRAWREGSAAEFWAQFGWAGVHAFSAWLVAAPIVFLVVHCSLRPMIHRLDTTRTERSRG